jgi:hypothetical protein
MGRAGGAGATVRVETENARRAGARQGGLVIRRMPPRRAVAGRPSRRSRRAAGGSRSPAVARRARRGRGGQDHRVLIVAGVVQAARRGRRRRCHARSEPLAAEQHPGQPPRQTRRRGVAERAGDTGRRSQRYGCRTGQFRTSIAIFEIIRPIRRRPRRQGASYSMISDLATKNLLVLRRPTTVPCIVSWVEATRRKRRKNRGFVRDSPFARISCGIFSPANPRQNGTSASHLLLA